MSKKDLKSKKILDEYDNMPAKKRFRSFTSVVQNDEQELEKFYLIILQEIYIIRDEVTLLSRCKMSATAKEHLKTIEIIAESQHNRFAKLRSNLIEHGLSSTSNN